MSLTTDTDAQDEDDEDAEAAPSVGDDAECTIGDMDPDAGMVKDAGVEGAARVVSGIAMSSSP